MAPHLRRRRESSPSAVEVSEHKDRLSGIRPHVHDEDERPTREDLAPQGSQLFKLPVPLPRFLHSRRKR
jgi:hypothetical protein